MQDAPANWNKSVQLQLPKWHLSDCIRSVCLDASASSIGKSALFDVFGRWIMWSKHSFASRRLAAFTLATLSLVTVAEAQPYGPGGGGMMGGGWGWGMGGMGGFGGVGLAVLVVLGIAVLVFRRRNT
jgi:hypothetical protein